MSVAERDKLARMLALRAQIESQPVAAVLEAAKFAKVVVHRLIFSRAGARRQAR